MKLLLVVFLTLQVCCAQVMPSGRRITSIPAPSSLLTTLTTYWKLDETSDGSGAITRVDSVGGQDLTDNSPFAASGTGKVNNGVSLVSANSEYLSHADSSTLRMGNIDFTIGAWVKLSTITANRTILSKYVSAGSQKEYDLDYNQPTASFRFIVSQDGNVTTSILSTNYPAPVAGEWYYVLAWHNASADTLNIRVNNWPTNTLSYASGVWTGGTAPLAIGQINSAAFMDGVVDEVSIWKRVLNTNEQATLYNVGNGTTYPTFYGSMARVVFDGNSLTAREPNGQKSSYPAQTLLSLGDPWRAGYYNFGVSAQTTADMNTDAATQIDPVSCASCVKNVCVAWEITNDLFFGASTNTAWNNISTYCSGRRTAGFKVVVLTVLPRSDAGTPGDFETKRQGMNAMLRADYSSFADGLADVASNSNIGDAGDELNTTYYNADKVHMTETGYGVVAGIVAPVISGLP